MIGEFFSYMKLLRGLVFAIFGALSSDSLSVEQR